MSEAPKKIWMSDFVDWEECFAEYEQDTQYIRADLVDGLVEALEGLLAYSGIIEERDSNCATNKARAALAALKALEEE